MGNHRVKRTINAEYKGPVLRHIFSMQGIQSEGLPGILCNLYALKML